MKKLVTILCLLALTGCERKDNRKITCDMRFGKLNIEASNFVESSSFFKSGCIDLKISNISGSGFAYSLQYQRSSGGPTITYDDLRIVMSDAITIRNIEINKELWLFQFTLQNDGSFLLEAAGHYVIYTHLD